MKIMFFKPTGLVILLASLAFPFMVPETRASNGPPGGIISTLVVDPNDPNTLYAGPAFAGVFKTADGGNTWVHSDNGFPLSSPVTSFAIDPGNSSVLYATGFDGLFKSLDGGASWQPSGRGLPDDVVWSVVIDRQNPMVLYAGTFDFDLAFPPGGVFKSINAGDSWVRVSTGLPRIAARHLALDPNNSDIVYASMADFDGHSAIFKSINGGTSWNRMSTGIPADSQIASLLVDPFDSSTVYAGFLNLGVFKTIDGGASWQPSSTGLPVNASVEVLASDPSNSNTVYAGADFNGLWMSRDRGNNWATMGGPELAYLYMGALAFPIQMPGTIYTGTGAGVFRSDSGGESWHAVNTGIVASDVRALVADPTAPGTVYAGCSGCGMFKSLDNGQSWNEINTGLTSRGILFGLAMDRANTIYAGSTTPTNGVYATIDGGQTWESRSVGLPSDQGVHTIALDPNNRSTLYSGMFLGGVWKSTDSGASWKKASVGLPADTGAQSLAIDSTNSNVLYAGLGGPFAGGPGGLFKSTNAGATWQQSSNGIPTPLGGVFAILIHPADVNVLFAAVAGRGVFKSTDGGATWIARNTGLTSLSVRALTFDPQAPDTLYLGTTGGLFKSTNGGDSWARLTVGLTTSVIERVLVDPFSFGTVYAGTAGGGVFVSHDGGQTWN